MGVRIAAGVEAVNELIAGRHPVDVRYKPVVNDIGHAEAHAVVIGIVAQAASIQPVHFRRIRETGCIAP